MKLYYFIVLFLLMGIVPGSVYAKGNIAIKQHPNVNGKIDVIGKDILKQGTIEGQRYMVNSGESLWDIAGRQDVYGDNFQWPLIFKANRDQIQDPDIINAGQDLAISKEFSQEEISMAIDNAKKTPRYKKHRLPRKRLPIEY